jgi:hypothetical protein
MQEPEQIRRRLVVDRKKRHEQRTAREAGTERLTDWRGQFEKRPLTMLGVAVGGGILLGVLSAPRSRKRKGFQVPERANGGPWREVKSLLFGVLSTAAMGIIEDALPRIRKKMSRHD